MSEPVVLYPEPAAKRAMNCAVRRHRSNPVREEKMSMVSSSVELIDVLNTLVTVLQLIVVVVIATVVACVWW